MKATDQTRREDALALLLGAAACIIWTLWAGKDMNWDLVNYHYYLPYSLLEGRLEKDFFPANTQSYLNPLGYVPLYLFDRAGFHSALSLGLMAAIHSLNIFFLYRICRRHAVLESRRTLTALAVAIGLVTQPFWLEVGNSFIDILTSVPILAAIYLLGGIHPGNASRNALYAGLLFGIAAGLKPTNAIVAVPGIIFIFALAREKKFPAAGHYIFWGIIGTAISGGYWAYKLYALFGSPVFPLYNSLFQAPDFPAESLSSSRFIPNDLIGAILFPFRMMLVQTWIYVENMAPDIRYALVVVLLLVLPLRKLAAKFRSQHQPVMPREQIVFVVYVLAIFYAWVVSSANGRYGLPQLLLVGPLLLVLLQYVAPDKIVRLGLLTTLIVQLFIFQDTLRARWTPAEWSAHLFDVQVPDELRDRDYLFLSTTGPSNSYLATYFSPDSVFVNVRGQHILTLEGPGGEKLKTLIDRHSNNIRSINHFRPDADIEKSIDAWVEMQQGMFARYGLRTERQQCVTFPLRFSDKAERLYLSCELVLDPAARQQFIDETAPVDAIFDRIAASCPKLFSPNYAPTEHQGQLWKRHYLNTEINLVAADGQVKVEKSYSLAMVPLGQLEDWLAGKEPAGLQDLCNADLTRSKSLTELSE